MATHFIEPSIETLHGPFLRDRPPVLTVDPGDTIVYRTLDARWRFAPDEQFEPRQDGHALCGPVAVRGAEPGLVLAVRLEKIRPAAWGWTAAGGWSSPVNDRLGVGEGERFPVNWSIDVSTGTATNQFGRSVGLRPFMGVVGMPADEPGEQSTGPPRNCGGNIDCRELVEGSILYLPIAVRGALLSIGDGHAAQGDGEVSGTAIECPMEEVRVTIDLVAGRHRTPRAFTPAGWITFGFHDNLQEATAIALEEMLDLLVERFDCERREALALASVAVDLRITQLVNGVVGVHAVLPDGAIY